MALKQRTPGVYYETLDPAARRITEVRSDIAGFVGVAERGPLHEPVKVESWAQFQTRFGGQSPDGYLAYAVYGFFANGGATCWVVRVGDPAASGCKAELVFVNRSGRDVLRLTACDEGPGSQQVRVRVEPAPAGRFSLLVRLGGDTLETWKDLSMDPDDERYVVTAVNRPPNLTPFDRRPVTWSVVVRAEDVGGGRGDTRPARARGPAGGPEGSLGDDGSAAPVLAGLTLDHFTGANAPPGVRRGLACLEVIEEVSLVAMPDLMWPGQAPPAPRKPPPPRCQVPDDAPPPGPAPPPDPRPVLSDDDRLDGQRALVRHCAALRDRFALLDAPWGLTPDAAAGRADALRAEAGQFAGLYYPWLYVPDPLTLDGLLRAVPPSGHVAGMAARVDLSAGVQKPPANERLEDARAAAPDVDGPTHGTLNDAGVNVIRAYPNRGVRVAGARTLVDRGHAEWQYVNVRRLLLMIEQSIDRATQWVVFQPNSPARWREMDRVVRNFLDDEWRRGRLDGASAVEAYSVTCDETTNPPEQTDLGRLICVIGVQPPQPAEFVVVRIGRTADQTGTGGEGRDAGA